jgi:hypothetical protein
MNKCPGCDGHECDDGCQYPMTEDQMRRKPDFILPMQGEREVLEIYGWKVPSGTARAASTPVQSLPVSDQGGPPDLAARRPSARRSRRPKGA